MDSCTFTQEQQQVTVNSSKQLIIDNYAYDATRSLCEQVTKPCVGTDVDYCRVYKMLQCAKITADLQ